MILKLIKHSCFWNKLRILKQVFLSLKKNPQEKAFQKKEFPIPMPDKSGSAIIVKL